MSSDFVNQIKNAFSCDSPSAELFVCDTTASTNDDARAYASSGSGKNAVFIAKEQTAGRGRRGRSFISREGGLYLSYLHYPTLPVSKAIMLTVFSAVALSEVIEEMTDARPRIKWVNDVFLGGKKLAGILAEGGFTEDGQGFEYAVVGIGVNLCGRELPNEISAIATTLEKETGVSVNIPEFALRLSEKLSRFEESLADEYMKGYRERSLIIGKRVKMTSAKEEFFASVLGIENDGGLTVRLDTGEEKTLYSAEVGVIL
ncbi:MAG: biotin--[acetyl-CoA-carboxylase] ligase [Ruminococcaceae bacterium]|nr:biotin--[acetyl-CoA-carboxylase] ligase [Oscillospiraceae bacterium]